MKRWAGTLRVKRIAEADDPSGWTHIAVTSDTTTMNIRTVDPALVECLARYQSLVSFTTVIGEAEGSDAG